MWLLQVSLCTLSSLRQLRHFSITKRHDYNSCYVSMPWSRHEAKTLAQVRSCKVACLYALVMYDHVAADEWAPAVAAACMATALLSKIHC